MRTLEFVIVVLLAARLLFHTLRARRPTRLPSYAGLLAGLAVLLQLAVEGSRWQMAPLYVFALAVAVVSLRELRRPIAVQRPTRRRVLATTAYGLALIVALALPATLPVPELPSPSGPHQVGTTTIVLVDEQRREIYADDADLPRTLIVQLWYPADPEADAALAPWLDHIDAQIPALARSGGLPAFMFGHLRLMQTHSFADAPLSGAEQRYPVLHFSHGYGGFRSQATFLAEDLASHGYVVVSTEHPYAALNTIFPDGRVAPFNPDTLPEDVSDEIYAEAARRLLRQWVADTRFVQDSLAADLPSLRQFEGRLDFEKIGAFGHSTGGGAALQYCIEDDRCQAVLGLDAWMLPVADDVIEHGLNKPGLFLFSDPAMAYFEPENRLRFQELAAASSELLFDFTVAGTGHHDFDDTGTFSPIARYFGYSKGPIDIKRAFAIDRAYTLAFFDQMLLGKTSDGVEGLAPWYPEVTDSAPDPG